MLTTRELRALSRDLSDALTKLRTMRIEDDKAAPAVALINSVRTRIVDAIPPEVTAEPVEPEPRKPTTEEHVAKVTALVRQHG